MTKTTHRLFTHTDDTGQRDRLIGQVFGQMFLLCRDTLRSYPSDLFWDIEWIRTYLIKEESTFLWSFDQHGTLIGTDENYIRQRKHAYRLTVRGDGHWWVLDVEELA